MRALFAVPLLAMALWMAAAPPGARGAESGFATAEVVRAQYFEALRHNVVDVVGTLLRGRRGVPGRLFGELPGDGRRGTVGLPDVGGGGRADGHADAVLPAGSDRLATAAGRRRADVSAPAGLGLSGRGAGRAPDMGVEGHLTNPNPGEVVGPWGHKVANRSVEGVEVGFADFFHRLGGVASFGFPKTEARRDDHLEANLLIPGRPPDSRIRQYYQAAVLEYHPESPGAPVKLRLLGDTLRDRRYPGRAWEQYLAFGPEEPLAAGDRLELGLASRRGPHGATAGDVARFLELSLLRVTTDRACGTGFVVTASGYAVTTWRLVMDAAEIGVESPRGYTAPAHLVAGDVERDLALIKVAGEGHIPVLWDDSAGSAVGTRLVALGHAGARRGGARGVDCASTPTPTTVSVTNAADTQGLTFLPAIDIGKAGGPVATQSGRVVGMTTNGRSGMADHAASGAEIRQQVGSWIDNVNRGTPPSLPLRPRFDRIVMYERDHENCSDGLIEISGSEIEISTTVSLIQGINTVGTIIFRSAFDREWTNYDIIYFGSIVIDGALSRLSWIRNYRGVYKTLLEGDQLDIDSGNPFHLRFVYNNGVAALFLDGQMAHQVAGMPHGQHIELEMDCGTNRYIDYYDFRIIGRPLL